MPNPLFCPFCGKEIESTRPYPKSKKDVKTHIKIHHPDKKVEYDE